MKYLKTFESFGLNKKWVISALDDDELRDIYEYLVSVNANPQIYIVTGPKLLHNKEYDKRSRILYTDNEKLEHRFLIGKSTQPKNLPYKIIPDIEKEKYIQQQLAIKKYNL